MERMIRKYKDRAIVAQTPQQKAQALGKVREWEEALDELIEKQPKGNHLNRHKDREKTNSEARSTDVTKAFLDNGTPGNGSITADPEYVKGNHKHEISISETLLKVLAA